MPLARAEFDFVRDLVRTRSAIVLDEGKEYLVESRLAPLVQREGVGSIADLVSRMRTKPNSSLHTDVVEALTTNETSFFRDLHPFDALREVTIPDLIERRRATRTLRIWCAACSSGQEPYTIAMLLHEHFPELRGWNVSIVATDISSEMLQRTREGKYSQLEVNRGLPAQLMIRWFERQGTSWVVKPELRKLLDVRHLNLAAPWPPLGPIDIVFLRNVLIYFDVQTKREILGRVRQVLRADGSLFLGAAETTLNLDDAFGRVPVGRATCYRLSA